MNLLINFRNKKTNPYYKKLSRSMKRQGLKVKMKSAYFLFGFPYSNTSLKEVEEAIIHNKLDDLKSKKAYNVSVDNVELYLIEETNNNLLIVLLLDPYELFKAEKILKILPLEVLDIEKEKIFPY